MTEQNIRDGLVDPKTTVDDLIDRTGLGTKCTACLLDVEVILDEVVQSPDHSPRAAAIAQAAKSAQPSGHLYAKNQLESGLVVEDGDTHTRLRCVNRGLHFGDTSQTVPFNYWLRIFADNGTLTARHRGTLGPDDSLDIAFADLVPNPFSGWFMLALKPSRPGLEGSIRPQIALIGSNCVATVHTQPHWSACKQKSVLLIPGESGLQAAVSIINAARRATQLTLLLATLSGETLHSHSHHLPARGACRLDLDEIFPPVPAAVPLIVRVISDQPVRKHIITKLADGRLGIDHFPNSK